MQPTAEQRDIAELVDAGFDVVIEAGAGTGKTTTLDLIARSNPRRRGQYWAFNRAIVDDAALRMPGNLTCRTMHSSAMGAVGRRFRHRLDARRQSSDQLGRALNIERMMIHYGHTPKVLSRGFLGSLVMRSITMFCQSDDEEPGPEHVPYIPGIDMPTGAGERTTANNQAVAEALVPYMLAAWADLCHPDGILPYAPAHYLKLWEQSDPQIRKDFVVIDEAQDLNPVMLSIVRQQLDCQRIYVGDSAQQVYSWTGAINALAQVDADARAQLSQSFRFGQASADIANRVLQRLGLDLRLVGHPAIDTVIAPLMRPDCVLTRTNSIAVATMLDAQRDGRSVHLLGAGGKDDYVRRFATGAMELQTRHATDFFDLACFGSWNEAKAYAEEDPQGDELRLMIDLVDEYTAPRIIDAIERMPDEASSDLVVSTAHKAKGREWNSVQLAHDFMDPADAGAEEWRLIYVAMTRARFHLDVERCEPIQRLLNPGRSVEMGISRRLLRL